MRRARELLARSAWRARPSRPAALYPLLLESQWRSHDELRALQADAVRELLRAAGAVPFHRDRLTASGLVPDRLRTVDDLAALPVLERADLQRLGLTGLCVPGRRGRPVATSGSTGAPVRVLRPLAMAGWIEAVDRRAREWSGTYRYGQRRLLVMHTVAAGAAATPRSLRFRAALAVANETVLGADEVADPAALRRTVRSLERRPAALVRGVSSMLYVAAGELERAGLEVRARGCWTGGNQVPDHYRTALERVFGCPVYERYAAWETGPIAYQCPEALNLHVVAESVLVEVVREDGSPAGPGEIGHAVVTPLRNTAMPLLRYRIGDLVEVPPDTRCPCGRGLPVLGRLIGRSNGLLRSAGGGRVAPEAVSNQMRGAGASVLEFQVTQRRDLTLDVKVVQRDDPPPEPYRAGLAAALDALLGLPGATRVERVDGIPLTAAGKLRHVVSEAEDG